MIRPGRGWSERPGPGCRSRSGPRCRSGSGAGSRSPCWRSLPRGPSPRRRRETLPACARSGTGGMSACSRRSPGTAISPPPTRTGQKSTFPASRSRCGSSISSFRTGSSRVWSCRSSPVRSRSPRCGGWPRTRSASPRRSSPSSALSASPTRCSCSPPTRRVSSWGSLRRPGWRHAAAAGGWPACWAPGQHPPGSAVFPSGSRWPCSTS